MGELWHRPAIYTRNRQFPVTLAPYFVVKQCMHWVPPISGHLCVQVVIEAAGYAPQFSQRNIDVNEPLQPGVPDSLTFPVGNPFGEAVTITLGLIPHLPDWTIELTPSVLPNIQPGETRTLPLNLPHRLSCLYPLITHRSSMWKPIQMVI